MRSLSTLLLLTLAGIGAAHAGTDAKALEQTMSTLFPDRPAPTITPAPMPGVSEVTFGTEVFYVSNDGRFLLGGPLIAVATRENLTDIRKAVARRSVLEDATDVQPYRYPAAVPKHRLTIVTDIDCPYCRRLHNDLDDYRAAGLDVSYVMLPRSGKGSPSYRKAVAAACADDPEAAITEAMNGADLAEATTDCEHPIDAHLALARRLGASSTPTLILEDGRMLLGARGVGEVLAAIGPMAGDGDD
ncbi:MAG: DsbC family protein [Pseudomonadota bacterium]